MQIKSQHGEIYLFNPPSLFKYVTEKYEIIIIFYINYNFIDSKILSFYSLTVCINNKIL